MVSSASDGVKRLADLDSGALFVGLTESSSHTRLKSIGTGTGQHFINSNNMPGVNSASHVEVFFTGLLDHVFVGGNTGSFQSARRNLFFFPRDHVDSHGEFVT